MENELVLVEPNLTHKMQAINFVNEVEKFDVDENIRYSGFGSLQNYKNDYEGWLKKVQIYKNKETVPEGRVCDDTFFSIRKSDGKIVGIISIRHELNEYLYSHGGHIGYCILPSERRKEYAYKQLLLALDYCKSIGINRVLITCLDYNVGSIKTIEKAGGKLENIVYIEDEDKTFKRYWISLKKRYALKSFDWIATDVKSKVISVDESDFNGDIAYYNFAEVKDKFIVPNERCILDKNYKWLEFYDYSSRVKLTAMYDKNDNIVQWYFDIAREIGKENNIPYEDDLYLDVVLLPNGEVALLDEEELKEALNKKEITQKEYEETHKIAKDLMDKIKGKSKEVKMFTDKYLYKF